MRGVSRDTQSVALVQITAGTIACERDKIARRMPALRRCSGCPRPKTRKSTLDLQRTHSRCIRKPWQATYSWQTPRLGPVAQRLEQGTHNPLVGGSNPSGPTDLLTIRFANVSIGTSHARTPSVAFFVPSSRGANTSHNVTLGTWTERCVDRIDMVQSVQC